jgi:SAM-dependent methyltransferase
VPIFNDDVNVILAENPASVDAANQRFYARFPYPWPPQAFPCLADPDFETVMVNQSLGDFSHRTIPADASIWVAGCGTNQAVYTALRFPKARVVGSDLSPASLDICRTTTASLGLTNLTLRQESLNDVAYREDFDYIINTGVIHHNAQPGKVLKNLARAVRPDGVIELMVYNRFHRTRTTAFQKAVRAVSRHAGRMGSYEEELEIARAFATSDQLVEADQQEWLRTASESEIADALIQPVEYSYTVESLHALAAECGLSMTLPCYNQFDKVAERRWSLRFATRELQQRVETLPDVVRWQITNLLRLERSPMLWFFLRPSTAVFDERYERHVNEDFLGRRFVPATTDLRQFIRGPADSGYALASGSVLYPSRRASGRMSGLIDRATGARTMRDILPDIGIDPTNHADVSEVRINTTTSLSPYLKAI